MLVFPRGNVSRFRVFSQTHLKFLHSTWYSTWKRVQTEGILSLQAIRILYE